MQWVTDNTFYSANVQNEDNKETICRSSNFKVGKIHISTEQEERLIDDILIIRCDLYIASTLIPDVGTGATPRIALRNGSIAHPQHTSHASSFLLDPTAGYGMNPMLCTVHLPWFGIAFKMSLCQDCQKTSAFPSKGTGIVSINKQGSLYHRNPVYSATDCRRILTDDFDRVFSTLRICFAQTRFLYTDISNTTRSPTFKLCPSFSSTSLK